MNKPIGGLNKGERDKKEETLGSSLASKVWVDSAKNCIVCGKDTCLRVCSDCREAAIEWAAKQVFNEKQSEFKRQL